MSPLLHCVWLFHDNLSQLVCRLAVLTLIVWGKSAFSNLPLHRINPLSSKNRPNCNFHKRYFGSDVNDDWQSSSQSLSASGRVSSSDGNCDISRILKGKREPNNITRYKYNQMEQNNWLTGNATEQNNWQTGNPCVFIISKPYNCN